jgi:hypothetical protein
MRDRVHHIAGKTAMIVLTITALLILVQPALADNTRKSVDRGRSAVPTSAIRYATPMFGAADIIVTALGRQQVGTPERQVERAPATTQIADTTSSASRVISTVIANDVLTVRVELAKDQQRLDIGVFNMLGKRLTDVYIGPATKGVHEYSTPASDLPEGVFVCIVKGDDFRRAAKFYLNR